jgi:hypothetical protein
MVRVFPIPTILARVFYLLILLSTLPRPALAHRPYEIPQGIFKRSDNIEIAIVKRFVDGILFSDPVAVLFKIQPNTIITNTPYTRSEMVVRIRPNFVELFEYKSSWFPVADSILRFDGFQLTEIPMASRWWTTPFIHTRAHIREYLFAFVVGTVTVISAAAFRQSSKQSALFLKHLISTSVFGIFFLLSLVTIIATDVSPFILALPITLTARLASKLAHSNPPIIAPL